MTKYFLVDNLVKKNYCFDVIYVHHLLNQKNEFQLSKLDSHRRRTTTNEASTESCLQPAVLLLITTSYWSLHYLCNLKPRWTRSFENKNMLCQIASGERKHSQLPISRLTNKSQYSPMSFLWSLLPRHIRRGTQDGVTLLMIWTSLDEDQYRHPVLSQTLARSAQTSSARWPPSHSQARIKAAGGGGWLHLWANKEIVDENEILMSQGLMEQSILFLKVAFSFVWYFYIILAAMHSGVKIWS